MENQTTSIESLWDRASDYIDTRTQLFKLKAIDKASGFVSAMVTKIILVTFICMFLILLNIGLALWIGVMMGDLYWGFFIVGGFYGLLTFIFYLCRHQLIKGPVNDAIIKNLLD